MIPLIPDQWKNVALNRLVIGTDSKGSRRAVRFPSRAQLVSTIAAR
jgi:hypothetical protein